MKEKCTAYEKSLLNVIDHLRKFNVYKLHKVILLFLSNHFVKQMDRINVEIH